MLGQHRLPRIIDNFFVIGLIGKQGVPNSKQKLHIRKDHIQAKKIGQKKLSNHRAFTGELAVKVSQNEPNRVPAAYPTRIQRYVSELPTIYIFQ